MNNSVKCDDCSRSNPVDNNYCGSCGVFLRGKCGHCEEFHHKQFMLSDVCVHDVEKVQQEFQTGRRKITNISLIYIIVAAVLFFGGFFVLLFYANQISGGSIIAYTVAIFTWLVVFVGLISYACSKNKRESEALVREYTEKYPVYVQLYKKIGWKCF